ncbi:kelch domain-containing protein 10 homolog isoform X2 [Microplitis demolitor]|uniref:kelch domain-containing protein 10 homolog isoform X2 n=1 Tax=Microplitis demolitor TaxID=69319 RepID=UPI0004CD70BF|nr:kelch domain-containing protein 10 homolog isoform X2 [Microplitis demolitor]
MYVFKPFAFTECKNKKSKLKPSPRTFPSIFCDEKHLYSFSGYRYVLNQSTTIDFDNPKIIEEILKFNLATSTWTCLPNQQHLPTKKEMVLGVTLKADKLIVATWIQNYRPKSFIYICDLKDEYKVIKLTTKGPIPKRLFSHNFISYGSYLYTIGTDNDLGVFRINPIIGNWEKLHPENGDDFPERYEDVELAFDGKKIFVFFVKLPSVKISELKTIHAYDIEQNRWFILNTIGDLNNAEPFPDGRINFGTGQLIDLESKNVNIIISGGINNTKMYDDVWQLNLHTLQWTCFKRFGLCLPKPICEHDAAISSSGKMFIFGGRIKSVYDSLNGVNKLYSAWIKIPKLTNICWEAVNYYYKDLDIKTSEELYQLGLPVNFVNSRYFLGTL